MPPLPFRIGLLALALAGCQPDVSPSRTEAPADSAAGTIPFQLEGDGGASIVVPVEINGQPPRPFVLDTGATLTCVDAALADSLGLPQRTGVTGVGASLGGTGNVSLVRLDTVRVGGAAAYDLTACAIDLSVIESVGVQADGLIGLNFLKSFRVGLDFETETLTLESP